MRKNKWDTIRNSIDIFLIIILIFSYLNIYINHQMRASNYGFALLAISLLSFRYLINKYIQEYEINQDMLLKLKEINEELEQKILYASELSNNLEKEVNIRTQEIINKNRELNYSANYDVLTNIPNRRYILNYIDKLIEGKNQEFSLIMLDIDGFKNINDEYGHDFGDKVIQYTGRTLQENLSGKDIVARLGGDEFLIVIQDSNISITESVAQKLINIFNNPYKIENREITTTISMGIGIFPKDGINRTDLMISADVALYKSKKCGRARYTFSIENLPELEVKKAQIERNLGKNLDAEHLKEIENIKKFLSSSIK